MTNGKRRIPPRENREYLTRVINWAMEHRIGWNLCGDFDENTPSASDPETRMIVINTNYYLPEQLPYHAAHEVAHVMLEHSGVLYFHGTAKTGMEAEANRWAVNLLVSMYFEELPPDAANLGRFMAAFAIPADMRDYCESAVADYYKA